jgi:hypothetical protein
MQQWHPDRHRGDELAKRRFQQIQEAYEGKPEHLPAAAHCESTGFSFTHPFLLPAVLIDSRKRETYDLKLVHLLDVEVCVAVAVQEQLAGPLNVRSTDTLQLGTSSVAADLPQASVARVAVTLTVAMAGEA